MRGNIKVNIKEIVYENGIGLKSCPLVGIT